MSSQFLSSTPASGSGLTARSLLGILCLSLSVPPLLSLSQNKEINIKRKKRNEDLSARRAEGHGDRKQKLCESDSGGENVWCHSHLRPLIPRSVNPACGKGYWVMIQSTCSLLENRAPARKCIATLLAPPPPPHQVFKWLFHYCSAKPAVPWWWGAWEKNNEFHTHGSIAALCTLASEFLGQKQCCVEHHDGG